MDEPGDRPKRPARGICLKCREEYHHLSHCPIHHDEQLLDLKDPNVLSYLSEQDLSRMRRFDTSFGYAFGGIGAVIGCLASLIAVAACGMDVDLEEIEGLVTICGIAGYIAGKFVGSLLDGRWTGRRYDRWLRYKPDVEAELTPEEKQAVTPWYLRA